MSEAPTVTPWDGESPPTEADLVRRLAACNLRPYRWANNPGDVYTAHTHGYDKVIYVVRGSITFGLPDSGETLTLRAGDRLDLPAGTRHDAQVGDDGVVCLEAHQD